MSPSPVPSISIIVHFVVLISGKLMLTIFGHERLGLSKETVLLTSAEWTKDSTVTMEDIFGERFLDTNISR